MVGSDPVIREINCQATVCEKLVNENRMSLPVQNRNPVAAIISNDVASKRGSNRHASLIHQERIRNANRIGEAAVNGDSIQNVRPNREAGGIADQPEVAARQPITLNICA